MYYNNEDERKILLDMERRCNGKSRCEMAKFSLPFFYLSCGGSWIIANNIDIYYWCRPTDGDNVIDISSSLKKTITNIKDKPQYFIYNNTSSELNQIVCIINGTSAKITVQLLYVDWSRDCESLKENISIGNQTYGCKTYGDKYKELEHMNKGAVKIAIFKQLGVVWLQIEANTPIYIVCQVNSSNIITTTDINTISSTTTPSIKQTDASTNLLFIVIPASTLVLIILVTIVILYRLGIICKNQLFKRINTETDVPITSDENGEYSTINEAASPTPRPSREKVAYYDVDTQSLLLKQQKQYDKSNIEHHTSPTTQPRAINNHYVEAEIETTYATVNKKPRSTNVQVNQEQTRSMEDQDTQRNDNVYVRLQHLQNSTKQTENVYSG